MLTILLWKWHGKTMGSSRPDYGPLHVNTMVSMIDRWLKMPHEFVLVSDDFEGIDGGVRKVPLWDDLRDMGRCFVRLKAFAPEMRDILGERLVSIDLDTVVCGPLDPLFDRPESFVIWSDPSRITPYCGSMWMTTAGAHPEVWTGFDPAVWATLKPERGWFGSDQAWFAHAIPGAALWTRADGVYSFRMHIARHRGRGGELLPGRFARAIRRSGAPRLPENARMVMFHGIHDPSYRHILDNIPWVREHWR